MKNYILLAIICLLSSAIFAQAPPSTGLLMDEDNYSAVPELPNYGGSKYNNIPIEVSLRPYCPIPGNQGRISSCVGWSTGYGALSILRAMRDSITDRAEITKAATSALYVYDKIKADPDNCDRGTRLPDALNFLKEQGDCFYADYEKDNQQCGQAQSTVTDIQGNFHIKDFATAFGFSDSGPVKVDKTRKLLANNSPVMIGMMLPPSFMRIKKNQDLWESKGDEQTTGGHAMVVTGYDEVLKAFEVMNSWGSEWGDNGFIWIGYEDFGKYVKFGFQMILAPKVKEEVVAVDTIVNIPTKDDVVEPEKEEADPNKIISGDFEYRYPKGYLKDADGFYIKENGKKVIDFRTATPVLQNDLGHYELEKKGWKVNDIFQLLTKNVPEGKYVYVFSIDPANEATIHWPSQMATTDGSKKRYANYIPSAFAEIIIPGPGAALQLTKAGTDHLIVLYANQPIEDFEKRVIKSLNNEGTGIEKFQQSFSDLFIQKEDIIYDANQMKFSTKGFDKEGQVVPIVLSIMAE